MKISDWINVVLCVFSFVLAAISVVTVVVTLRQNNKMIENATRPYIAIKYEALVLPGEVVRYVVIKNYGQSEASIINISCDGCANQDFIDRISKLSGTTLAPGQRILYYFGAENPGIPETLIFSCTYFGNKKIYKEEPVLKLIVGSTFKRPKNSELDKAIPYLLQEIAERII